MSNKDVFFYHYLPHHGLHSFPTRRSSDLRRQPVVGRAASILVEIAGEDLHPRFVEPGVDEPWMQVLRSEEHTSELQSRPHLVCRLLLEKKNRLLQLLQE